MNSQVLLTQAQIQQFHKDGYLLLPGFYEPQQIEPICRTIYDIIGLVIAEHQLDITRKPYQFAHFDDGYIEVIKHSRRLGSVIYDAVKQVPGFLKLVADSRNEDIFQQLRPGAIAGIAAGGFGIRINNPYEEQYRAAWHQEYPGQLRSVNGLVFWTPLLQIVPELGPVDILSGSQIEGLLPVLKNGSDVSGQTGGYALRLKNEEQLVERYSLTSPCTQPGDLLIMDFKLVHRSGKNIAQRALWSMQFRWFDYAEPIGRSHHWIGSYASGVDFSTIHPELCIE
ncbi:MAG: phytanoyl-CoA dioxygenase family protein [Gammaproteobacteria bacterium]|jgi:hypothetical protein|nr:phytanoyl-CoA dioxygenase family protein [Gammaproteobacteria bacterium]MBU2181062.1 phytanoyl-CoA dioxygenase family protein [Gammaproteobacteria bacterium]MBU2225792.1 phytanoyl-CoA dioxygenase family protein [Gammaproteobacteria bacterium]